MAENEARVIRELSKSMINKIAAGEVVERPASVVKELAENSIDAGATRIDVEVEKSGVELIKVIDNGCGIPADQIELALSPHATSKISRPEDLFHIATLGFRGEALASIAEISHLTLTTRAENAPDGARIRCDGNQKGPVEASGRNVGTTIEIRDLFFNVPVRRKFLKSPMTEYGQIKEAIVRLAIPHPEIAFTLRHNSSLDLDLPPATDMFDRIRKIFGDRVAGSLVRVERQIANNGVVVDGYIGRADLWRGTGAMQYLFVNGRFFRDKALFSALKAAYQGLLKQGTFPVVFLNLETPLDFVDVNVHPTKQEVHFLEGQSMYAGLLHSVRDRIESVNLERRPDSETIADAAQVAPPASTEGQTATTSETSAKEEPRELRFVPDVDPCDPRTALDDDVRERGKRKIDDWYGKNKKERGRSDSEMETANDGLDSAAVARTIQDANEVLAEAARRRDSQRRDPGANDPAQLTRILQGKTSEFRKFPNLNDGAFHAETGAAAAKRPDPDDESTFARGSFGGRVLSGDKRTPTRPDAGDSQPPSSLVENREEPLRALSYDERRARIRENNERADLLKNRLVALTSDGRPVVQLCNRYLVMEAPDGIALVDQHALHERILYEKLKAGYEKGDIQIQRLLVPEAVDLSPAEFAFAMDRKDLLASLGVLIEALGGSSVVINGYPAIFSNTPPAEIFQTALGALFEKRAKTTNLADMIEGALCQMACKAAIKAGDGLTPESVAELVAQAEMEVFAHHCPHGRPSTVVFTTDKIDQFFIRD